jgi:hypothetical protein
MSFLVIVAVFLASLGAAWAIQMAILSTIVRSVFSPSRVQQS